MIFFRSLLLSLKQRRNGRFSKTLETAYKIFLLLLVPLGVALATVMLWYFVFFRPGLFFHDGLENVIITALIPGFLVVYGLFTAAVYSIVYPEFKTMRIAAKRYDVETFIDFRDEELSPVVRAIMITLSIFVLAGFFGIKYPDSWSGALIISGLAFVLALLFFVALEIDDPCNGIWVIKEVHRLKWHLIDVKAWRALRQREEYERLKEKLSPEKRSLLPDLPDLPKPKD